MRLLPYFTLIIFLAISCKVVDLPLHHTFPSPVDTHSRPITDQEKRTIVLDGVEASNEFPAARMNDFTQIDDSTFRVTILPENEPINESPHFAFSISSTQDRNIDLELYYGDYKHRYYPKLSYDKQNWTPIDSARFDTLKAGSIATLKLELSNDALYVAAQEIHDTEHTKEWISGLAAEHSFIQTSVAGQSERGRDIHYLNLGEGDPSDKPAILIFSRTHPPEISGYMAMEKFVETILENNALANAFRKKYNILVYPLINPDGVDLGHWRHNTGGIDLNRDWAVFRQAETRTVAKHVSEIVKKYDNEVVLGIDFHSTQEDVIYTHTPNRHSMITPFKDVWIEAMEQNNYGPNEEAYDLSSPMTKGWFYMAFGAEAIIYEVGDETDRAFLRDKATFAANEMMKLLVLR